MNCGRGGGGGETGVRQSDGGHGLNVVGIGSAVVCTGQLTSGPSDFRFFQFIQNWLKFKNQNVVLTCSINSQFLHVNRLGWWSAWRGCTRREGTGEGHTWATAAVGSPQKNSNLFNLFKEISKRSDLIRLKMDFPDSEFFSNKIWM
jgi:hypothetical protein